ncbi:MAG: hypothetical protein RL357_938 [Pseudomonadota bacterium]
MNLTGVVDMNKVFKRVWSASRGTYVAVAETARSVGKSGAGVSGALIASVLLSTGASAQDLAAGALPTGGQVSAGQATIATQGTVMDVTQSSQRATIHWQGFDIGRDATVRFNQPSASAVTLNRVVGASPSMINGAMNANGQVILVNANGVVFANGSQVNVGGLVATTKQITDANFQAGHYVFEGDSKASVLNLGTINAARGGYVALMGKEVGNQGTISATGGRVELAGGERFTLNLNGNSMLNLTIDQGALDTLVANGGLIQADGGVVHLSTQAVDDILNGMVNHTGVIEANSLSTNEQGEVILFAHGGTANIGGEIKAQGGFVETSGDAFAFQSGAHVQAAHWLIDPTDITVDQTMANGFVATLNGGGDVTVTTTGGNSDAGHITVADGVIIDKTGEAESTLTLRADSAILVGKGVTIQARSGPLNVYLSAMNGSGAASRWFVPEDLKNNIVIKDNFTLTTNGGNFMVGGALGSGGTPTSGNSNQPNVFFGEWKSSTPADSSIDTGSGDIQIWGYDVKQYGENYAFSGNTIDFYAGNQLSLGDSKFGQHITAADRLLLRADYSILVRGKNSPGGGQTYITPASKGYLKAGNEILIENTYAGTDADGSINVRDLSIEMTGSGDNVFSYRHGTWVPNASLSSQLSDLSVTFAGKPVVAFELGQGSTQEVALGAGQTIASALQALSMSPEDYLEKFVRTTSGTHFGLKGESYTLKFANDSTPYTIAPEALDNGLYASGNGLSESINQIGNLKQPFYYDNALSRWFKTTFGGKDFGLVLGLGTDPIGDEAGNWNSHGEILFDMDDFGSLISNVAYDYSGLSGGVGTAKVTYELATSQGNVKVSQAFVLKAGGQFIKGVTKLENIHGSDIQNVRLWVGVDDDFIAISDENVKTKGNLTANGFEVLQNQTDQARALVVSEFDWANGDTSGSAVIFHSTNTNADTVTSDDNDIERVYADDPRSSPIVNPKSDGSYGLFMNFGDVPDAEIREATWYYGVAPVTEVGSVVAQMVQDGALAVVDPTGPPVIPPAPVPPVTTPDPEPPVTTPDPEPPSDSLILSEQIVSQVLSNIVNGAFKQRPGEALPSTQRLVTDAPSIAEKKVSSAMVSTQPKASGDSAPSGQKRALDDLIRDVQPNVNEATKNKRLTLVSDTGGETEIATLSLDALVGEAGGGELRVALSPNSFVELVNGGVTLPLGVSQEFYVVEDKQ